MINIIKQWLAPPVFEGDEKKAYRVKLLNVMINLAVFFMVLIVLGNLLDSSTPPRNFIIDFIFIGMFLFLRRLLLAGRVEWVGYFIVTSAFILMTFSVASEGTILAPATALFSLLVIISGFIFNLRGIITATIISSLVVAGLILAHQAGILPPPHYTESTFQWFVFTCAFGLIGGLSYFYNQLTDQALERSRIEIHERRRVEMELRKLSLAVEQSPASIVITDLGGNIEYVNSRFTQVTGYGFDEAIGKNPRILKTDKTPPETYLQLWDTLATGKEWHGEFVNRKKDGSLYTESAIISPIKDLDGVITHYLAVKEDITERKRAEQALYEMRSRLQLLGENLEEAALYVYSHDTDGQPHFEYLSASMEKLIGVTPDEILRDASRLHSLILPEYMPKLVELENKSKEDLISFEIEVRQRHAITGNIHWALLRSTPRRRPSGSIVWYGVQIDITERKQNEKLLEKANEQLRVDMKKIEQLKEELHEQAIHDPLTGLYNRRYLNETLAREITRVERENNSLSVIMSDIDHFKMINDTYGHPVGDKFLMEIASLMKKHTRDSDIVCRYGGEEFLLVFPGTALASAAKRAEEIRQQCAGIIIQHEGKDLNVTMSLGVATYPTHGKEAEEIIIKVDKALYQSKQSGRNRVTAWVDEKIN